MTLNQNEVIRFTNLPTGTKYKIQEIYANYYKADYSDDSEGHPPIQKESNISAEGYEIAQVQTTNGTVTRTAIDNDTVSGIIVSPNVRYYNQFTNHLKTVKTKVTILKTDQDGSTPLPGAVFDLYDEAGYGANPKSALKTDLTSSAEAGKEGKALVLAGRITDLGGAAADKDDRLVAGLLQAPQHHDRNKVADVQRRGRGVKADIGRDHATGRRGVQFLRMGDLVDVAARLQGSQELRLEGRGG